MIDERAEFFKQAQINRYENAVKVDSEAVAKFDQRANAAIRKTNRKEIARRDRVSN